MKSVEAPSQAEAVREDSRRREAGTTGEALGTAAMSRPGAGPMALLALQRAAGNRAVSRLVQTAAPRTVAGTVQNPAAVPLQRCGEPGCDCVGEDQSQGHPLQRVVAPITVQRNPGTPKLQEAIDKGAPDLVAALDAGDLGSASVDERMTLIDILLDKGGFTQQARLPAIWDTFGKGLESVATQQASRWQRSFAVAGGHMRQSREVRGLQPVFYLDVEDIAKSYLDENERYCKREMERLGLDEQGQVRVGPPTAAQTSALATLRDDATKLAADQDAMADLRTVVVGYSSIEHPPGGTGPPVQLGGPVTFDPDRPATVGPQPGDTTMKTWAEVKKAYDDLDALVRVRVMLSPTLFPLVRGSHEDATKSKTVATGEPQDALATLGSGLKGVLDNIAKTRPLLHVLAEDLEPIQAQLLTGSRTAPGAANRNWKFSPFYEAMAKDIVDQHKPGPWWLQLGLLTASMGAYVVAGMATGGAAFAFGMAAKGAAEVAVAQGKADALAAASQANVSEATALVSQGQVDEAQASVIEKAAFALLDVAFAGLAARGVLADVYRFEEQAAQAAKRASAAADKALAKQAREEAEQLAKEARKAADEAKEAAASADAAAKKASEAERARSGVGSKKAADDAVNAERSALDAEAAASDAAGGAAHAPDRVVGDHALKIRGNWVTRCTDCVELVESVADRARSSGTTAAGAAGSRAGALAPRFNASAARAGSLAERARNALSTVAPADRIALENRLLDEGALIEREVQALERQLALESIPRGSLGRQWGEQLKRNVAERTDTIRLGIGTPRVLSPDLSRKLADFERDARALAADAERLETRPRSFSKAASEIENDLSKRWAKLDEGLDGVEREERARREMRGLGGSLGESDAEVRTSLGIPPGKKSPDIAIDAGSGTLVLAESKGSDIPGALEQFRSALGAPGAARFPNVQLRIYLKADVFEKLVRTGEVDGFRATKIGDSWFLPGMPEVGGRSVQLLPI
jgi:hypothetical protein